MKSVTLTRPTAKTIPTSLERELFGIGLSTPEINSITGLVDSVLLVFSRIAGAESLALDEFKQVVSSAYIDFFKTLPLDWPGGTKFVIDSIAVLVATIVKSFGFEPGHRRWEYDPSEQALGFAVPDKEYRDLIVRSLGYLAAFPSAARSLNTLVNISDGRGRRTLGQLLRMGVTLQEFSSLDARLQIAEPGLAALAATKDQWSDIETYEKVVSEVLATIQRVSKDPTHLAAPTNQPPNPDEIQ